MTQNIDQNEVNKFAEIAEKWWDPTGDFKPLHVINPLRANYINKKSPIDGLKVLDVGCGGGLLAEALDAKGAKVTAIDVTDAKGINCVGCSLTLEFFDSNESVTKLVSFNEKQIPLEVISNKDISQII